MKKFQNFYERNFNGFFSKKKFRVMKITSLLFMLTVFQLWATETYSQLTKLTLKIENTSIADALREIENQSEFYFLYSPKLIDVERTINITVDNETIKDILDKIFNEDVKYATYDRQIILTPNEVSSSSLLEVFQQGVVTGKVTDASTSEGMPGVNIQVKGTNLGTTTDAAGGYSLSVNDRNATLIFSFIGYVNQDISLNGRSIVDVELSSIVTGLDEVVVIGYGTVKKRDLTGSVASIKSTEIVKTASNNAIQSLQGKIAGLDITRVSGSSGSELLIDIRGNRSILASNTPLFLVDGIEYGSILDLNASDIESIDVLKDASSTAIYGTRGANGVILITTKKGLSNKTTVRVNSYLSFNSPTNLPQGMNAEQSYLFIAERQRYNDEKSTSAWGTTSLADYTPEIVLSNVVSPPFEKSVYQLYQEGGVNWFDLVLRSSITKNCEILLSGGYTNTSFSVSLGYMDELGSLKNDNLKRYNGRIHLNHKITKTLSTGINLQFTVRDWDRRNDGIYGHLMKMQVFSQPYLSDGTILDIPSELALSHTNPLLNEVPGYYVNNVKNNRMFGNIYLDWEIIKRLRFKSVFGIDQQSGRNGEYEDFMTTSHYQGGQGSSFSVHNSETFNYTFENTLTYTLTSGERDEIQLLAGQSAKQAVFESHGAAGIGTFDHYLRSSFYDLTFIPTDKRILTNDYVRSNLLSYFGRVNYKLMDRYLFTATIRADGSSVLSAGNQWGYFPSVAAAWIISEEPFLNSVSQISNLKLRLSWGKSGNAAISPYQTLTMLGMHKVPYAFGTELIQGQLPANLGNLDLTWETSSTYNIGLDLSLVRQRINATLDFYKSHTDDLLVYKGLPATSVYTQVLQNVGKTENVGFEAAINLRVIEKKYFSWNNDITFSTNRDKIISLASGETRDVSNKNAALIVGEPVRAFYNYEADGCWKIDEADEAAIYNRVPGDIKIIDVNNDDVIDELDKRLYSKSPKFILGWNSNLAYRGISLSALVYSRVGQWISYSHNLEYKPTVAGNSSAVDFWTPENPDAKFPRPGLPSVDLPALAFEKASFLKIREIILSYSLAEKATTRIGLNNLKIYCSMQNYFIFSNLNNYDPERGGGISDPMLKQIVLGLDLEF
jgi:TonB-linked SusC/RagA family outer membrane protein